MVEGQTRASSEGGEHRELLEGTPKDEARHLGPHIAMSSSSRGGVTRRILAARSSFHSLGVCWSIPFSFQWKRTMLTGFGQ
eukprot:1349363-Pyramimonas_sp.AAC.1